MDWHSIIGIEYVKPKRGRVHLASWRRGEVYTSCGEPVTDTWGHFYWGVDEECQMCVICDEWRHTLINYFTRPDLKVAI